MSGMQESGAEVGGPLRPLLVLGKYETIALLPKMNPNVDKCLWFLVFVSG